MIKILPTALLSATAVGSLLFLPAGPAQAQSAACSMAVDVVNSAFVASPDHTLDADAQRALTIKLQSIAANGKDKAAIDALIQAIAANNGTDLDPAVATFKSACSA